jgi:5'-deoxynucleotidase YfbR-like HD superfamily hydrolase
MVIVHELCGRLEIQMDSDAKYAMISWAMMHDTPEGVLGDPPTPTKLLFATANKTKVSIGDVMHSAEAELSDNWAVMDQWARTHEQGLPYAVVKIAEEIEVIRFLTIEGVGAYALETVRIVDRRLHQRIRDAQDQWPQYDWSVVVSVLTDTLITRQGTVETSR